MSYSYILFNKPYNILSQFTPEGGNRSLEEFGLPKGVYPVGRLDKDSEGLLLLSDDGPFIKSFLDNHERTYWVQVENIATKEQLQKLRSGVKIKSGMTKPCQVKLLLEDNTANIPPRIPPIRERKSIRTCWLEITLTEGKNRQIRRMTAAVGLPTLRLIRVGLGKYFNYPNNPQIEESSFIKVDKKEII